MSNNIQSILPAAPLFYYFSYSQMQTCNNAKKSTTLSLQTLYNYYMNHLQ